MGKHTKLEIGQKIGMLTIFEKVQNNGRWGYICKCDCGNTKWVRTDRLTNETPTNSCGCLSKETQFKAKDISGKRFGRLVAIKQLDIVESHYNWLLKCDCGKEVIYPSYWVVRGDVVSCGCYKKERLIEKSKLSLKLRKEKSLKENTDLARLNIIVANKLKAKNKSGIIGVIWDYERKKWKAQISFKGSYIYLGRYENKKDAIVARKQAEEKYFKTILEKYEKGEK